MSTPSKPKVLIVSMGTAQKSSCVARLGWLKNHSSSAFEVRDELGWPFEATPEERRTLFQGIVKASADSDVVVLHRVLFGRAFAEEFFSLGKPVIYDIDDAIYAVPPVAYRQELRSASGILTRVWRTLTRGRPDYSGRFRPLTDMLRRVTAVSAGNPHLARFASRYCSRVRVIPTVVDVERFPIKQHHEHTPVNIGWYGSPDNHWYLRGVGIVFAELLKQFGGKVRFEVISSLEPRIPGLSLVWIPWQRERETKDLLNFDIGLMPLTEDEWSRGKSGNKAIYYMAGGIPPVVSPVGVNAYLFDDGTSGFLARTPREWIDILSRLVRSVELRASVGANARKRALESYSRSIAAKSVSALVFEALDAVN